MLEHPVESTPLDPLHRVIAKSADLANVKHRHNMSMVQPGCRPRLVEKTGGGPMNPAQRAPPEP